jgi:hypothetical protein
VSAIEPRAPALDDTQQPPAGAPGLLQCAIPGVRAGQARGTAFEGFAEGGKLLVQPESF